MGGSVKECRFQRARSKVFHESEWGVRGRAFEWTEDDNEFCLSRGSPSHKSQDSGFSDSEEPAQLEVKPLDLSSEPGSPTHTSTPKSDARTKTRRRWLTLDHVDLPKIQGDYNAPKPRSLPRSLGKKFGRAVNLLNWFNSSDSTRDPVKTWLADLGTLYEPECTTTLQSKSLAVDVGHFVTIMAANTKDTVRALQQQAHVISAEFAKLCQRMEFQFFEQVPPLVQSLVGHVTEFLHDYHSTREVKITKEERELLDACERLRETVASPKLRTEDLPRDVATLGHSFTHLVDLILSREIKVLVAVLEEPTSDMALRSALSSLAALGLEGSHLSRLVAHCGGIRALLSICLESRSSSIRIAALRALATVCCVVDGIRELEKAGGVEIIGDILSEENNPEEETSEAAAVLAQITAPWIDDNHHVEGLSQHMQTLVTSLTRLASGTSSCETLLLASAALANITFMEPQAVWTLLDCGTVGKLLRAVRRCGPKISVFLQDQVATLLANMAASPESRTHLADQRAVVSLLCFLQIRPSPLQRSAEISATERVQQKSAIALSRLCSEPSVAKQVVELRGVERLVKLCKEDRERNHSDGVLVACLAALRKISSACGTKVIEDLDALELVEPRLLDSFLIYSSRQESYV